MADGKPRSVVRRGESGDDEDVEDDEEDDCGSGSVKGPSKWIRCAGMTSGSSLVGTAAELTVASEDRILAAIWGCGSVGDACCPAVEQGGVAVVACSTGGEGSERLL